ncbi:hypothetical protein [Bradyrhizobium sp.]|jgi:hypothetical protein
MAVYITKTNALVEFTVSGRALNLAIGPVVELPDERDVILQVISFPSV